MFRFAAAAMLMAISTPAFAADWYYVDAADDGANISFIDKDSIRTTGTTVRASMFSLLATVVEDAGAYRFDLEIDCKANTSRMVAAEIFDADDKSGGEFPLETEWKPTQPDTQGVTIMAFICGGGKVTAETPSAGKVLPFATGRTMLAARKAPK